MRPQLLVAAMTPLLVLAAAGHAFAPATGVANSPGLAPWTPTGMDPGSEFGFSIATAGDVDGDGYNDILVGAPGHDGGQADQGRAFLYRGGPGGPQSTPAWQWSPGAVGARAGESVAPAGDVNGDGYHDVIVGAPRLDEGTDVDAGAAYLFFGGPSGLALAPDRTYKGPVEEAYLGQSVATAGDVNGDGYAEVLLGMPGYRTANPIRGGFWLDHGGAAGPDGAPNLEVLGSGGMSLGASVAGAFDVNGDGYADVVVGNPLADGAGTDAGEARVYHGSSAGLVVPPDTTIVGAAAGQLLGASVAGAGDVDGDGYADLLIGAPGAAVPAVDAGRAILLRGSSGGITSPTFREYAGAGAGERLGASVATGGDLDSDGRADLLLASPGSPGPGGTAGRLWVVFSAVTGPEAPLEVSAPPAAVDHPFAVATGGDLDGDGFAEILSGDPSAGSGGLAFIHLGGARAPRIVLSSAMRSTTNYATYARSVDISPWVVEKSYNPSPQILVGSPLEQILGAYESGVLHRYGWNGTDFGPRLPDYAGGDSTRQLGSYVRSAGDVDRNGCSDFAVGAPSTIVNVSAGSITLLVSGLEEPLALQRLEGTQLGERFGSMFDGGGDFNGDGYHDLIVGSPQFDPPGGNYRGRVTLYLGGPTGLTPAWTRTGTTDAEGLGSVVAWIGDLDGDGYSDFAVSAAYSTSPAPPGRVDVHYGGPALPPDESAPAWSLFSPESGPRFGATSIAGVGDIDGDGVGDLGIGEITADSNRGRVYFYRGQRGRGRPMFPSWVLPGAVDSRYFGSSIAGGADLTGDGIADFVVGDSDWPSGIRKGRIHVFAGGNPEPDREPIFTYESTEEESRLGYSISRSADLDMDGVADFAIGAPGSLFAPGDQFVAVLLGGGGLRRSFQLTEAGFPFKKLIRPALATAVGSVGIALDTRSAEGRGWVRPELEVETQADPFDGDGTVTPLPFARTPVPIPTRGSYFTPTFDLPLPWPGIAYRLRARTLSRSPYFPRSRWITPGGHVSGEHDVRLGANVVGVAPVPGAPVAGRARLTFARPNPAGAGTTTIVEFVLPVAGATRLDVYDARGRHVRSLFSGLAPAGPGRVAWDGIAENGTEAPSGLYFVSLRAGGESDQLRVVRVR